MFKMIIESIPANVFFKDPELAKLYYEDELQIIKTRKGA